MFPASAWGHNFSCRNMPKQKTGKKLSALFIEEEEESVCHNSQPLIKFVCTLIYAIM